MRVELGRGEGPRALPRSTTSASLSIFQKRGVSLTVPPLCTANSRGLGWCPILQMLRRM